MLTPQQCREKAAEAESLARLVSLETDRKRLADMARGWREKAEALEAQPPSPLNAAARR
jgi:hypothetical protein